MHRNTSSETETQNAARRADARSNASNKVAYTLLYARRSRGEG